jgi:hypothetical protein
MVMLVDLVLHGLIAVQGLVLVQLHLGRRRLGLAALLRQLPLCVRSHRRLLDLFRRLACFSLAFALVELIASFTFTFMACIFFFVVFSFSLYADRWCT